MTKVTYADRADFNQFTEYVLSDKRIVRRGESAGGIYKYTVTGTCDNRQSYMDEIGDWTEIDEEELVSLLEAIGENEPILDSVMTSAEVCEEFGLNESTVRKAIERDTIPARKSAGTWLIRRADAEARWSDRRIENEQYKKLLQAEQDRYVEEGLNEDDADLLPPDDGMAD